MPSRRWPRSGHPAVQFDRRGAHRWEVSPVGSDDTPQGYFVKRPRVMRADAGRADSGAVEVARGGGGGHARGIGVGAEQPVGGAGTGHGEPVVLVLVVVVAVIAPDRPIRRAL